MPPPNSDDALLARLNALKQSSVTSLSTHPPSSADEITPDALRELGFDDKQPAATTAVGGGGGEEDPILDLAARFKRLNGGKAAASGPTATTTTGGGEAAEAAEEEKSLDELLKELGGEGEGWGVSREDERDVGALVREVRSVLPDVPTPEREEGSRRARGSGGREGDVDVGGDKDDDVGGDKDDDDEEEQQEADRDALDEQEADEYIAQVLAELDLESKYADGKEGEEGEGAGESAAAAAAAAAAEQAAGEGPPTKSAASPSEKAEERQRDDDDGEPSFSLPAAPTSLPTPPPPAQDDFDKATAVDDALTARFAALARGSPGPGSGGASSLPSAPSFAPSKKPPIKAAKFTDEEIDSWCIICYANATVRCLGCDGDLYCQGCWNEGHRGESAGYEERTHRAVQFVKGGGLKKVPVGAG
ncbi:zinc fyve domain containing protein [Diplodia corticola]|uniref:Zinc fyve domain containing protein n=1 Tax=Diplodia corticola TaxID=236234 RepID=A0A1J9RYM7_9PEZI|nr:zinc fyve domain containing protein [Diplodia corticola]OJD32916.1 zinc fyve domain containing protein [Diplodia corticola]